MASRTLPWLIFIIFGLLVVVAQDDGSEDTNEDLSIAISEHDVVRKEETRNEEHQQIHMNKRDLTALLDQDQNRQSRTECGGCQNASPVEQTACINSVTKKLYCCGSFKLVHHTQMCVARCGGCSAREPQFQPHCERTVSRSRVELVYSQYKCGMWNWGWCTRKKYKRVTYSDRENYCCSPFYRHTNDCIGPDPE